MPSKNNRLMVPGRGYPIPRPRTETWSVVAEHPVTGDVHDTTLTCPAGHGLDACREWTAMEFGTIPDVVGQLDVTILRERVSVTT